VDAGTARRPGSRIARRWQRSAVTHIFVAAAAERDRPAHIAHVVTAVVEHAEEPAIRAEPLVAGAEAGARLNIVPVFAGEIAPVLDPSAAPQAH
jgi:hypothetical protein